MKSNKKTNQQGYALIIIVVAIGLLLFISTSDILSTTTRQVNNADIAISITNGDRVAAATISPIKEDIAQKIHTKLGQDLKNRLQQYTNGTLRTCQGTTIDKMDISELPAICDPRDLLSFLTGKTNQNMDFLSSMKPISSSQNSGNPNYDWQYGEIKREAFNLFDYSIQTSYVGSQLLQEASGSKPRLELHRYQVQTDVNTHTYNEIFRAVRQNYDVVLIITTYGNTNISPCDPSLSTGGTGTYLNGYQECTTNATTGLEDCKFVLAGTAEFDRCKCTTELKTCFAGKGCNDAVLNGKRPVGEYGQAKYKLGCVTSGTGSKANYASDGYSWFITVRPVAINNNW